MTFAQRLVLRALTIAWVSGPGIVARAQVVPAAVDMDGAAAPDISGTWDGTFRLDSAWRLPQRATARSVRAQLQFSPVGDATPATSSPRSVHAGTFDIEFSKFGFMLSTHEALGWTVNPDSIRAVLNPTVDHGLVELHATFRNDTLAVGQWRYNADPGGARGTFEIRRTTRR